jgi:hypothetical protein
MRVRINILKVVAKCSMSENEIMYLTAFTSRPLLHVKPKESSASAMAYTFGSAARAKRKLVVALEHQKKRQK